MKIPKHYKAWNMRLLAFVLLLSIPTNQQCFSYTQEPEHWITVFVHGIMSVKPHLSVGNFIKFMRDEVHDSIYSETVRLMRNDDHFYKNQAMQGMGLQKIDDSLQEKGNASGALAQIFTYLFNSNGSAQKNYYYTFGWSGLLSPQSREQAGKDLYNALEQELISFHAKGIKPKIRIIGYSHGGNVGLNVAKGEKKPERPPVTIDQLILWGMPVQADTDYLVNNPVFKRVFHFYSRSDRIQKLDFFSFKRFFSQRVFKERKSFNLPQKLTQIQLKIARPLQSKKQKNHSLPQFHNKHIISGNSHSLRNASPGHAELWFFGWTAVHYSQSFPIEPLPTIALLPLILNSIDTLEERFYQAPFIIADIRPHQEILLFKADNRHATRPLITQEHMKRLQEFAHQFEPKDGYPPELYEEHIKTAFNQASRTYQENNSTLRRNRKIKKTTPKRMSKKHS